MGVVAAGIMRGKLEPDVQPPREVPAVDSRAIISASRTRSKDSKVATSRHSAPRHVGLDDLVRRRIRSRTLLNAAIPVLDEFSASLEDVRHVVYITDADGIVLYSRGTDFMMESFGLRPGFDWSEKSMGTNGAGTALASNAAVAVVGAEHWVDAFRDAACLAAPIRDKAGNPVGAIDLSTALVDCRQEQMRDVMDVASRIEKALAGL